MARIVVELTNRCNLRCKHCFDERHAATNDLPLSILEKVLREGRSCEIDQLSFTGGEPTIHREFTKIVEMVADARYPFSFVSNGINFPKIYTVLVRNREWFKGVTFSCDGAREETHEEMRGKGAFRHLMQAASVCVIEKLPFTFNMVLTAKNRHEVTDLVELADGLGAAGVRFGHLMATIETSGRGLDLTPTECREVENEIWGLQKTAPLPVGIASGHYSESPLFPCGPLELKEYNLDCRGNLTLCCHLSGQAGPNTDKDVMGNLHELSLHDACERFRERVALYLADKRERVRRGEFGELDHFPCWYCSKYMNKVDSLRHIPDHPWMRVEAREKDDHADFESASRQ